MQHIFETAVVDESPIIREGVKAFLQGTQFEVVSDLVNGASVIELLHKRNPKVVMLDSCLPDIQCLELASKILSKKPDLCVVLMVNNCTQRIVEDAQKAGVRAVISKKMERTKLIEVLQKACHGLPSFVREQLPTKHANLTNRETQILRHIAKGHANKVIAYSLDVTEGTVKVHIKTILRKLGLSNRTQAAIYAYETGVL